MGEDNGVAGGRLAAISEEPLDGCGSNGLALKV